MARVAILVGDGFEDAEFQVPCERLRASGHELDVISAEAGADIQGKRGDITTRADLPARAASAEHYAALVIPGGHGPDRLRTDEGVVSFVRHFMDSGRPVAAICHGPQLLIEAGRVRGRTLTSWPSVRTDLINAGATWVDQAVVVDENLITSRKPADLEVFCDSIEQMLARTSDHSGRLEQGAAAEDLERSTPDVQVDEEGFLVNPDDWDEDLARWLARREGIEELSEPRWKVIRALRELYLQEAGVPDFRRVCEAAQQDDVYCMERLFDNNGSKAWRIAGLPNPGEEIKAYL
jgi:protease I